MDSRPSQGKRRFETFSSLKNRNFRLLWLGIFAYFNSMQMLMVARGWLVYTMTDSPLALGIVSAGAGVPILLFSLFGGAVADRVRKRNLLLLTQSCICMICLAISILISTGLIALWQLVVSSILSGVIVSFGMPARQAFLVELVEEEQLTNAIALNSMATNMCRIASPAIAGVLLKLIDVSGVYWLVTVSYSAELLTLSRIPAGGTMTARPDVPLMEDVLAGLRHVKESAILLTLLVVAFVPIVVATPYQMLMPVFAKTIFEAGETGLGLLMAAGGLGALTGSTLIASLGNLRRKGLLMLLAGMVFGVSLVSFGVAGNLIPGLVCMFFVGTGGSMMMTLTTSLIMNNTPRELLGRVMSIFVMTFGLMPLATLPAGALAQAFGASWVVSVGGMMLFFFMLVVMLSQPHVRRLN
jgi:MFS family permease